jgi:transcriptional regulator with XRE-family HTH domain
MNARISAEGGVAHAFGAYLRAQRKAARMSLRELADLAQISNPYLSQVERGLHQPSVAVIRSLAEALNLSAEVLLAEAAGLQRVVGVHRPGRSESADAGVEAAIEADPKLSRPQKAQLLEAYQAMVGGR